MRAAALVVGVVLSLVLAPSALAKTYRVTDAGETFQIESSGTVHVTERLTFAFSGSFHGAYRLIPATGDESITDATVSEDGAPFSPGASADVGSSGDPGTYGVEETPQGWTQIAWHFDATDTTRTFVVSYDLHGYVDRYTDVGNLYLQVWGSQWPVPLDRLHATVELPGPVTSAEKNDFRVWGHPASVKGTTRLASPSTVTIDATNVPATQFVEADVAFPARLVTGDDVQARAGTGLDAIVQREKQAFASPYGTSSPVGSGGGSGGWFGHALGAILAIVLFPILFLGRLFGFFKGGSGSGSGGFGGSFGGSGGGGGGGGGGGAW